MLWTFLSAILLIGSTTSYGQEDLPGNCTETIQVDSYQGCSNLKGHRRTKHEMDYKQRKSDRVLCFKAKSGRVQISCICERTFWHYCCIKELLVYDGCNGKTVASQEVRRRYYWSSKWTSKKTSCLKVAWFKDMSWREKLCVGLEDDLRPDKPWRPDPAPAPPAARPPAPAPPPRPQKTTTTRPPCKEQSFNKERGNFSSPDYPNSYPTNQECIYKIERPENTRIQLIFQMVDLPLDINGDCRKDFIKIYKGTASWAPLKQTFCGKDPVKIISSGNKLKIRFISDQSGGSYKGFKAIYGPYPDNTAPNETQKVTGVVIGTACGLVFLALTFLAICNSRRLSLMHFRRRNYDIQSNYGSDAIQEKAPPSYDDVMASPEKYPLAPCPKLKYSQFPENEELPSYPGITARVDPEHEILTSDDLRDTEGVERMSEIDSIEVFESHDDDDVSETEEDARVSDVNKNNATESDVKVTDVEGNDVERRDEDTQININEYGAVAAESNAEKESKINNYVDACVRKTENKSSLHEYPNVISTVV